MADKDRSALPGDSPGDGDGETGRTEPYQVDSPPGAIRGLFRDLLPDRPYCTNDPRTGLLIRSRRLALRYSHLQLNHPATYRWLPIDIDHPEAAFAWEEANVLAPNIIAANPDNGHAHLIYALAHPVHALSGSRDSPLRYLADVARGLSRRLGADPSYSGLIAKNPLSPRWRTRWLAPFPYRLEDLNRDLTAADKRRLTPAEECLGLGRNCVLFDRLREIAYREVLRFKGDRRSVA